ncbi:MAG: HD domain-containing protein [Christensenellales bacterium]
MIDKARYDDALFFATKKHEGQFRIGGLPYIVHPVAVAGIVKEKGGDTDALITALFHDLLEDTDATEEEILHFGNKRILHSVKLLTKPKNYEMQKYVGEIRKDSMAFLVKGADRLHNLRSAVYADTDFKRRYIYETIDWYLDFLPEIPLAVKKLAQTLDVPLKDLPFIYEPIENWKI